jgi:3',5'-cyclic AMP phosphodiesterase CpdA
MDREASLDLLPEPPGKTPLMARRRRRRIVFAALIGLAAVAVGAWDVLSRREQAGDGVFLVRPYLQWGSRPGPKSAAAGGLEVLWQGADRVEDWSLEVSTAAPADRAGPWVGAGPAASRRVAVEGVAPRRLYRAAVPGQVPGGTFAYRVRRDGATVFEARARAPWDRAHPHRFVVFGDGGVDTSEQRAVAYEAYRAGPDFVFITGDLVYYKGRFAEYLSKFFPIYNSDRASPRSGAPLLRSTLVLAAPGNHDLIERDLDRCPDGLAYFLLWSLPLNGPIGTPGAANTPALRGTAGRRDGFLDLAGPAYPRMANYSFDYGGVHWAVLDTNAYADWTDPALRAWLERDLASDAAREASWRFVAFHQPPFHSSKAHADEQRSRVLVDLFERSAVDLVFCGHIHNYQRTYPLKFVAAAAPGGKAVDAAGHVDGRWTLDTAYDGVTRTRPDGIIYIVSGAGGARLYSREQHEDDASWQPFTAKFIANTHSLTVVDVSSDRLTLRQVSAGGEEIDRFAVTRGEPAPAP